MNHPLFFTPEEAEQELRRFGSGVPTAESIRAVAKECPENLGFKVTVVGSRVYIPIKSFRSFWGIPEEVKESV